MKTKEQILDAVTTGTTWERLDCKFLDARDYIRLAKYFPVSDWILFELQLTDGAKAPRAKRYTIQNITKDMLEDLKFAITKAENQRGISASLMFEVMAMWLWILEDTDFDEYKYVDYGIEKLRAIERKYKAKRRINDNKNV